MTWFIFALIFILIALLIFGFTGNIPVTKERQVNNGRGYLTNEKYVENVSFRKAALFPLFIAVLLLIPALTTQVGTRDLGVVTTFNKPTNRNLGAGLHLKAPWNKVTDIDGTVHLVEYKTDSPINVKIGDLGDAKVALSYRWRIRPEGATQAFQDYNKSDDDIDVAVRKALVSTNVKAALNEELGTYNPLDGVEISANMTPSAIAAIKIPPIPYAELNSAVLNNVEQKVKTQGNVVEVYGLQISNLVLPEATQKKINAFNAAIQESRNTLVSIATKTAQATANEALAKSVDNSPNVLVSKCLDGLIEGDFSAPAGFNCWPGGGNSVVIPSSK